MQSRPLALAVAVALTLATQAKADLVVDGGFESPAITGGYLTFQSGSQIDGGFSVTRGSVDVVANSFFPAFQGNQTLDLDGSNPGTITQTLATTVGQTYSLTFAYANNPFAGSTFPATATVTAGSLTAVISHTTSTAANMNYTLASYTFVASSTSTVLTFASNDPATSVGGIVLDAISVNSTAVPEPSSVALVGLGVVAGLARLRRRRNA